MLAGLQAPVIMSQNGHAFKTGWAPSRTKRSILKADSDPGVAPKVDTLREQLVAGLSGSEQIALLTGLVTSLPIALQPT
jgi:hypothetical protein